LKFFYGIQYRNNCSAQRSCLELLKVFRKNPSAIKESEDLVKKTGVLNQEISQLIARMGHLDKVTICDAGLPIPDNIWRIDLAVTPGIPGFVDVTKTVAMELKVQQIILAEELKDKNPKLTETIKDLFKDAEVVYVEHDQFKRISSESRAIIRTGECTPYANVILVSGVTF
jgi:D-ribose pyranase